MKLRWRFILGSLTVGWLSGQTLLAVVAPEENPYTPIVARNVFGLLPLPTNNPADLAPATPLPKISPNGIMTVFGKLQVLFKVAKPPPAGQPAKDESYVMSEGDRQDDIEVQKIDEPNATITFNNHGTIQTLELMKSSGPAGGPPAGAAPTGPGLANPLTAARLNAPNAGSALAGRFGRNRNAGSAPDAAPPAPPTTPVVNGIYSPAAEMNEQNQMTAEQRILMIEAQRQKYLQEGNPIANMLPPTPMTSEVTGQTGNNGGDATLMPGQ